MDIGVKEVREIITGLGIETYSGYNDKRKTFTRRIKVVTKYPLSPKQCEQIKKLTGAFEVGNTGCYYGGLYVKIR